VVLNALKAIDKQIKEIENAALAILAKASSSNQPRPALIKI
jgi:hypothetical protein